MVIGLGAKQMNNQYQEYLKAKEPDYIAHNIKELENILLK